MPDSNSLRMFKSLVLPFLNQDCAHGTYRTAAVGELETRGKSKVVLSSNRDVYILQEEIRKRTSISMAVQVAHYTPSFFPLNPVINANTAKKISKSWESIVKNGSWDAQGHAVTGITLFYNEFYTMLGKMDASGKFEAVLARNVSGNNKLAAKGAIIVRIINFVCNIHEDGPETQQQLYMLGKMHNHLGIRPWQYSVFVQTLLVTITSRLGTGATNDIMEAWVNMFAFVLRSMLPPAIKGQVVETEHNINTSSAFEDANVAARLQEVEEAVLVKKRLAISPALTRSDSSFSASFTVSSR